MRNQLILAGLSMVLLPGCDGTVIDLMNCDILESEVVELSEGELIKVSHSQLISRSDEEMICEGIGIYSDRSEVKTRFRTFRDSEGDWLVEYDTDEAQAEAAQRAEEEFDRQWQAAEKEAEREAQEALEDMEQAIRDASY